MAKQDDPKHKSGQTARRGRSGAGAQARSGAARSKTHIATSTRPLPPLEAETEEATTPTVPLNRPALVAEPVRRRQFLLGGAGLAATALTLGGWLWLAAPHPATKPQRTSAVRDGGDKLVVAWNKAALNALRNQQAPLPVAART